MPGNRAGFENAQQQGVDEGPQFFLRWRGRGHRQQRRIFLKGLFLGIPEHFRVQGLLVAKMIVDGGHIHLRPVADFPDRGIAKTGFGKDLPRRLQDLLAGRGMRRIIQAG